jgi:hypothetical protein
MEHGGDKMRSVKIEVNIIIKANAPSLVPSKVGFASDGFLPYCGTFDFI